MAKNQHEKGGMNKTMMIGGIAALAAAAAGTYFLYGTDAGKKKRKEMKSWMLRAKADVMDRMENLKEINEDIYNKIVGEVAEKYKAVKNINPAELAALAAFMRSQWKNIRKSLGESKASSPSKRSAGKASSKKASK